MKGDSNMTEQEQMRRVEESDEKIIEIERIEKIVLDEFKLNQLSINDEMKLIIYDLAVATVNAQYNEF
jgi:hypothetical protein